MPVTAKKQNKFLSSFYVPLLIQSGAILLLLLAGSEAFAFQDVYSDFTALKSDPQLSQDRDYSIQTENRESDVTIMAIHGGIIEPPTDIAAGLFAKKYGFNSYLFRSHYAGPENNDSMHLHVTSTHYNDPELLKMAAHSKTCVSFHGNDAPGRVACIGGADQELRRKVSENLVLAELDHKLKMSIDANIDGTGWRISTCKKYSGTHPKNVVNRCGRGLQLELSLELRKVLGEKTEHVLLEDFLEAIHRAIQP